MTKFRKVALALAFAPVACFAADGDVSALDTVIQNIQSGLETMIGKIVAAVGAIVVAGLVFWGLKAIVRWARSYFGK